MQRIAMFLAILGVATAAGLTGGCKSPPTQAEMAAYEYGPRPDNYEKLIRDYLFNKLLDPGNEIVEFKTGPKQLFQQQTRLARLQSGCAGEARLRHNKPSRAARRPAPLGF